MSSAKHLNNEKSPQFYFLVALILLGLFSLWLFIHPNSPWHSRNNYFVSFKEIGYLKVGNAVDVNGLPKGYVKSFSLTDSCVWVEIAVLSKVKIPKNSDFRVANAGIMGERVVSIVLGNSYDYYNKGARIKGFFDLGGTEIGAITVGLVYETSYILNSIKDLADTLFFKQEKKYRNITNKAKKLEGEAVDIVHHSGDSLDFLLTELEDAKNSLERIIDDISPDLDGAIEQISDIEKSYSILEESLVKLKNSTSAIANKLNEDNTVTMVLNKNGDLRKRMVNIEKNANKLLEKINRRGLDLNVTIFK